MRRTLALSAGAAVAWLAMTEPTAHAQGGDLAAAQGLFDEAKQLMAAGKLAEACPKFLASFNFDPKPGTAMNLADCYEKTGRTASAWARYLEAASLTHRAGQTDREQYAREHAARLEPTVSRLSIAAASQVPGLQVLRDGVALDPAVLGAPVPMDPGTHLVEARAPGKKPWSRNVEVASGGARVTVEIPALEDGPAAPLATAPPETAPVAGPVAVSTGGDAPASPSIRKPLGFGFIGVGAAGVLVGVIAGGVAVSKHSALASACPVPSRCVGQDSAISSYNTLGTVFDVGVAVGAALAVTGIVLVATAPKPAATGSNAPPKVAFSPVVGPAFSGVVGRF